MANTPKEDLKNTEPQARQPLGATKPQFNLSPLTILLVAGLLIAGYMNVQTTYKYQNLLEENQQLRLQLEELSSAAGTER